MADPIPQQQIVESTSSTVTTVTEDPQDQEPVVRVKLRKPKGKKSVKWTTETVDNEHLNRKKSKCCCIYEKPKQNFDDSSSEDSDDECEHCHGHVEKKKDSSSACTSVGGGNQEVPSTSEVSQTVTIAPTEETTQEVEETDHLQTLHIVLRQPAESSSSDPPPPSPMPEQNEP